MPGDAGVPQLLTARELGERLRLPTARIYELAREDVLPHVRIGRQIRFEAAAVGAWIQRGGSPLPGGWRREMGS